MTKALSRVLVTFGTAADGRLGHGFPLVSQLFPRIVASLAGYSIKSVSCGGAHTAVVTEDGTLFTFGLNSYGQLGHSKEDKYVAAPIEVGLPDPVAAVAAGGHHTLALTTAGEVWAWGQAGEGALGVGQPSENRQVEPRLVKGLSGVGVTQLAAGDQHSLALTSQGEVYSWGRGDQGALGHGTVHGYAPTELRPRLLRPLSGVRVHSVVAGPFSSGAVDTAGGAHVWGHGIYWQLGTGRASNEMAPVKVTSLPSASALAIGQLHSLAVVGDGRVVSVGTDEHGSLGSGTDVVRQRVAQQPRLVEGLPMCRSVAVGWKHSAAVGHDGRLWTWGWSGAAGAGMFQDYGGGQLGHGDDLDRWAPEPVTRLHTSKHRFYDNRTSYMRDRPWRALAVAAGRNHTAAVVETQLDVRDLAD